MLFALVVNKKKIINQIVSIFVRDVEYDSYFFASSIDYTAFKIVFLPSLAYELFWYRICQG